MLATVHAATLLGVRGHPVRVEVHVDNGLPASGDLFVPAGRAELVGARTGVVELLGTDAHGGLADHRDALREINLFLADRPSACRSLAERLGSVAVPFVVESAHQLVTLSGLLGYLG